MQHSLSKLLLNTMSKTMLSKSSPTKLATKLPQGIQKPVRAPTAFEARLYEVRVAFPNPRKLDRAVAVTSPSLAQHYHHHGLFNGWSMTEVWCQACVI